MTENQMIFLLALTVILGVLMYALVSRVCQCIEAGREEDTDGSVEESLRSLIDQGPLGGKMMWFSTQPYPSQDEDGPDNPEDPQGFFIPPEHQ